MWRNCVHLSVHSWGHELEVFGIKMNICFTGHCGEVRDNGVHHMKCTFKRPWHDGMLKPIGDFRKYQMCHST